MVLTLLMAGFGLVLSRGYSEWQGGYLREPLGAIGAAAYSIIGVLILTRHPRHMVGRLFLIVGFFSALGNLHTGLIAVLDVGFIRDLSLWAGMPAVKKRSLHQSRWPT